MNQEDHTEFNNSAWFSVEGLRDVSQLTNTVQSLQET